MLINFSKKRVISFLIASLFFTQTVLGTFPAHAATGTMLGNVQSINSITSAPAVGKPADGGVGFSNPNASKNYDALEDSPNAEAWEITTANSEKVRVIFYRDDIFRIWMANNGTGNFTEFDPSDFPDNHRWDLGGVLSEAEMESVATKDFGPWGGVDYADEGAYYSFLTNDIELRAYKNPLRFEMRKADGTVLWSETEGIVRGSTTTQALTTDSSEYFYGGGMQMDAFSHKGKRIQISFSGYSQGTVPTPVPFYMTTKGYGVFRNTWKDGLYDFRSNQQVELSHNENRFDAYYFYGGDENFEGVLDRYTELTGRPLLIPKWGFGIGDASAYRQTYNTASLEAIGTPSNNYENGYADDWSSGYTVTKAPELGHPEVITEPYTVYGNPANNQGTNSSYNNHVKTTIPNNGYWHSEGDGPGGRDNANNPAITNANGRWELGSAGVVQDYKKYGLGQNIPMGWFLPNDGYGCEYNKAGHPGGGLKEISEELREYGVRLGLWVGQPSNYTSTNYTYGYPSSVTTNNGRYPYFVNEIRAQADWGVRLYKIDIAWSGTKGLKGDMGILNQMYNNVVRTNERSMIITVRGWAGGQRYAIPWTGDQSGDNEYTKYHITSFIGTGMSGYPISTSDQASIFGNNPGVYVRDLQSKLLVPMNYAMNNWAGGATFENANPNNATSFPPNGTRATSDKRPGSVYHHTDEELAINQKYSMLHNQLVPYMYSYARKSHEKGTPVVRPMVYNFPDDTNTYADKAETRYQYMSGDWLLAAPVIDPRVTVRENIYLPEGKWIDYWTGKEYFGPSTISVNAPYDTLPMFARAGAIVPMQEEFVYEGQTEYNGKPVEGTLILDLYPEDKTTFSLYEDDGYTMNYLPEKGSQYTKTLITSEAPKAGVIGPLTVTIGEAEGNSYEGQKEARKNLLMIHSVLEPGAVKLAGEALTRYDSMDAIDGEPDGGWFYDPDEKGGMLYVKTLECSVNAETVVEVDSYLSNAKADTDITLRLPQNVKATGISQTEIKVTWDSVDGASTYDIRMDGARLVTNVQSGYVFTNLAEETKYEFELMARNDTGRSGWTLPATGETLPGKRKKAIEASSARFVQFSNNNAAILGASSSLGQYSDEAPSRAIDGTFSNQWHSAQTGDNYWPAIEINLGGLYMIDEVEYYTRTSGTNGRVTNYSLVTSKDGGATWELASSGSFTWPNQLDPQYITFTPRMATHIRLVNRAANTWISGRQVVTYETADKIVLESLTSGKNVAASSVWKTSGAALAPIDHNLLIASANMSDTLTGGGFNPEGAVTGDTNTSWRTDPSASFPIALNVGWSGSKEVHGIRYWPIPQDSLAGPGIVPGEQEGDSNVTGYAIYAVSISGAETWLAGGEWDWSDGLYEPKEVYFRPVNSSRIKFVITGSNGGEYAAVGEFEILTPAVDPATLLKSNYIEIDLGQPTYLSKIEYTPIQGAKNVDNMTNGRLRYYAVEYKNADGIWVEAGRGMLYDINQLQYLEFNHAGQVQHIRIKPIENPAATTLNASSLTPARGAGMYAYGNGIQMGIAKLAFYETASAAVTPPVLSAETKVDPSVMTATINSQWSPAVTVDDTPVSGQLALTNTSNSTGLDTAYGPTWTRRWPIQFSVTFDTPKRISKITNLPRSGANGRINNYDVYYSTDNGVTYTRGGRGALPDSASVQTLNYTYPYPVTNVRIQSTSHSGIFNMLLPTATNTVNGWGNGGNWYLCNFTFYEDDAADGTDTNPVTLIPTTRWNVSAVSSEDGANVADNIKDSSTGTYWITKALEETTDGVVREEPSFKPENAVDGRLDTAWSSINGSTGWLAVDLGENNALDMARVTWGSEYATSFVIETLADSGATWEAVKNNTATGWSTVATGTNDIAFGSNFYVFGDRTARYVRLRATAASTALTIREFEVFGKTNVTGITLDKDTHSMVVGEEAYLEATVSPGNARNQTITWSCDNPDGAIDLDSTTGRIRAIGVGTAIVKATSADNALVYAECEVTVTSVDVTEVTLNGDNLYMAPGEAFQFTAKVSPSNAANKAVAWSSDKDYGTVETDGFFKLTDASKGQSAVTVTATAHSGVSGEATVDIVDITDIEIDNGSGKITVKFDHLPSTVIASAFTITYDNGTGAKPLAITTMAADTDNDAVILYYTPFSPNSQKKVDVTVRYRLSSMLSKAVTVDQTVNMAELEDLIRQAEDLVEDDYEPESWAKFEQALDKAKAIGQDATAEEITDAYNALKDAMEALEEITEDPYADLQALIAEAEGLDENDYTADTWAELEAALIAAKEITPEDDKGDIATAYTALRNAIDNLEGYVAVTSVKIDGAAIQQLRIRNTKQFTATVNPTNATDQSVTWESSNEKIFTVDEDGLVKGVGTGSAKLIVTCGGKTSFIMVQITA